MSFPFCSFYLFIFGNLLKSVKKKKEKEKEKVEVKIEKIVPCLYSIYFH